jgi:ribosomal-protein-alanine N-acetyltransferase
MPNVPTFKTNRLIVRELLESDLSAYKKHFINYEVIRHLGGHVPWPYPEHGVIDYAKSDIFPYQGIDKWVWAINLIESPNDLIGVIEFLRKPSPTNRGFWLAQPYWGNGYMTEAVAPITDYAFEVLGFEKLIFGNAVGNNRSARIKEKSGAQFVRREKASYVDPLLTERDIFELTRENWAARKD